MGSGASNLSGSDLSVYQSALTKISQNLSNSTSNASSIDLQSRQYIHFINGGQVGCDSSKIAANRLAYENMCQHGLSTNSGTSPSGTSPSGTNGCDYFFQLGALDQSGWRQCYDDCSNQAVKIFTECTDSEILAMTPTINCNITLSQNSVQNATTSQAADSQVDAAMSTAISSHFESEIDKTINQTNKDLNFMQFNSSDERTALSQSIRNDVMNAIAQSAQNISTTDLNSNQTVDFTNQGIINCSGCGASGTKKSDVMATTKLSSGVNPTTGNCLLEIDQSSLQKANTDQKANAALRSVFNNTVTNDLASKYKLAVTQTNTGVNLAELLLTLLLPLIFLIIFVPSIIFALKRVDGLREALPKIATAVAILLVLGGIVFTGLLLGCQIPVINLPMCNHPSPTPSPTPTPTPTPSPSPKPRDTLHCPDSKYQCIYPNFTTCTATKNCHPQIVNGTTYYCGGC